jgi:hypothetical protein
MVDALSLLSAEAVRDRADRLLALGLRDELPHFRIDLTRLDATADLVLAVMRTNYPAGDVPFHSRWRHFVIGGEDRWAAIAGKVNWPDAATRARAEFDLAIVSVLLDAGAGPAWRYRDDAHGIRIGRSEGLALASLDMFAKGLFSTKPGDPLRADADALARLPVTDLERGFQLSPDNPLVGIDGCAGLAHCCAQGATFSPGSTMPAPEGCSIILPGGLMAAGLPQRRSSRNCCASSVRSGRRASRSMVCRSAIAGTTRR